MHGWTNEAARNIGQEVERVVETYPELEKQPYPRLIKRLTWLTCNDGSHQEGVKAILDYFERFAGPSVGHLMDRLPFDYSDV